MWKQILGRQNERGDLSRALTLGTTFAVGMAVFSFIGFKIDRRRGDDAILFTVMGMSLGLLFGAYETWRVIAFLNRKAQSHTSNTPPTPPPDTSQP